MANLTAEQLGYIPYGEPRRCPICGAEVNEVYIDIHREVVGCDECVRTEDADGYICEICGEAAEELYYHGDERIGCDRCVKEVVAT